MTIIYRINDKAMFPGSATLYVKEKATVSNNDIVIAEIDGKPVCRFAFETPAGFMLAHPKFGNTLASRIIGVAYRADIAANEKDSDETCEIRELDRFDFDFDNLTVEELAHLTAEDKKLLKKQSKA